MRIVLYEWCSSGGLLAPDAASLLGARNAPPESLVAEGRAMLGALLRDALRWPGIGVVLLVDARQRRLFPAAGPGLEVVAVDGGDDVAAIAAATARADRAIVVAPETAGILALRVAAARGAVACTPAFLALASDKQATIDRLAARGVPVPAGRSLPAGTPVPEGFRLPAVIKAIDGCGGEGLAILRERSARPASPVACRLEAFVAGATVGVSCLCGPGVRAVLPPMLQRYDGSGRYLGGSPVSDPELAARAGRLASAAVAALEGPEGGAAGWVGVDMILGDGEDGRADRVLEVNPRLTTSFVGLSRRSRGSLVQATIAAAEGRAPHDLRWHPEAGEPTFGDR